MGSKTSTEYWHERFGEYPKADIEKLCCAMMSEYANEKTKQQREVIERLIHFVQTFKEGVDMCSILIDQDDESKFGDMLYDSAKQILKEAQSLLKEIE